MTNRSQKSGQRTDICHFSFVISFSAAKSGLGAGGGFQGSDDVGVEDRHIVRVSLNDFQSLLPVSRRRRRGIPTGSFCVKEEHIPGRTSGKIGRASCRERT